MIQEPWLKQVLSDAKAAKEAWPDWAKPQHPTTSMTPTEKRLMFEQTRLDCHMADAYATEMSRTDTITPEQASELLRRCIKANASAQAFERVMRGMEPPPAGR